MISARRALLLIIACAAWASYACVPACGARRLGSPAGESDLGSGQQFDLVRPAPRRNTSRLDVLEDRNAQKRVEYEIRYVTPEAEAVYLLWALDNWQPPDKSFWPPGAAAKKQYPYCKMQKDGSAFAISLSVPEGAMLDYCFNVLAPSRQVDVWDTNGAPNRDYHSEVAPNGTAVIIGQPSSAAEKPESPTARTPHQPARLLVFVLLLLVLVGGMSFRRTGRARGKLPG